MWFVLYHFEEIINKLTITVKEKAEYHQKQEKDRNMWF